MNPQYRLDVGFAYQNPPHSFDRTPFFSIPAIHPHSEAARNIADCKAEQEHHDIFEEQALHRHSTGASGRIYATETTTSPGALYTSSSSNLNTNLTTNTDIENAMEVHHSVHNTLYVKNPFATSSFTSEESKVQSTAAQPHGQVNFTNINKINFSEEEDDKFFPGSHAAAQSHGQVIFTNIAAVDFSEEEDKKFFRDGHAVDQSREQLVYTTTSSAANFTFTEEEHAGLWFTDCHAEEGYELEMASRRDAVIAGITMNQSKKRAHHECSATHEDEGEHAHETHNIADFHPLHNTKAKRQRTTGRNPRLAKRTNTEAFNKAYNKKKSTTAVAKALLLAKANRNPQSITDDEVRANPDLLSILDIKNPNILLTSGPLQTGTTPTHNSTTTQPDETALETINFLWAAASQTPELQAILTRKEQQAMELEMIANGQIAVVDLVNDDGRWETLTIEMDWEWMRCDCMEVGCQGTIEWEWLNAVEEEALECQMVGDDFEFEMDDEAEDEEVKERIVIDLTGSDDEEEEEEH